MVICHSGHWRLTRAWLSLLCPPLTGLTPGAFLTEPPAQGAGPCLAPGNLTENWAHPELGRHPLGTPRAHLGPLTSSGPRNSQMGGTCPIPGPPCSPSSLTLSPVEWSHGWVQMSGQDLPIPSE